MMQTYTYPDGSQRIGCPPFPVLSPTEEANGKAAPAEPDVIEVEAPKRGRKAKAD